MNRLAAFRVDAAPRIGHGHLVRCLTLADALRGHGIECHFLCRSHAGFPAAMVERRGHVLHRLPERDPPAGDPAGYASWLGAYWPDDARDSIRTLGGLAQRPAWLVVDHYAIDARWETNLSAHCGRLLVVDDLADRAHACAMLVDQTLGRDPRDYARLVTPGCDVLVGTDFAMLQPQYARCRKASLEGRHLRPPRRLLVAMGGVDAGNATTAVLRELATAGLPTDASLDVVLGRDAPWLGQVADEARRLPWPVEVHEGVAEMAPLAAAADLAIGAAGGSAWERCCLGLPAIVLVLADNQRMVAEALDRAGATIRVDAAQVGQAAHLAAGLMASGPRLAAMSASAAALVDGRGVERVVSRMLS